MKKFICKPIPQASQPTLLTEEESNHCLNVLRFKNHDQVLAFDTQGNSVLCEIEIKGEKTYLKWIQDVNFGTQCFPVTLELAMIKPKNLEWVIEKITEIGVSEVKFFLSERCNIRPKKNEFDKMLQRFKKISEQSLKQCQRTQGLILHPELLKIEALCSEKNNAARLVSHFKQKNSTHSPPSLTHYLNKKIPETQALFPLRIMIGPEGGFSEKEEKLFSNNTLVSLGPNILRAETAAIYAASITTGFYSILCIDKNNPTL